MAKTNIKGQDVGLFIEKTAGSGTYTRVKCVGDVSLDIDTESDEATCVDSGNFKEFEPGQNSWSGSANLTARQLTNDSAATPPETDATDGVSLENLIAYQLGGRKLLMRFTLGLATGAVRYEGTIFITKSGIKGQIKGVATGSISFQGTGELAPVIQS